MECLRFLRKILENLGGMKYLSSVLLGSAVVSAVSSGSLDAGQQCSDDVGCHYAGRCLAGICVCDPPFAGPSCESFDIESFSNKEGGLQMPQGNTTWGGSVVRVPEFDPKTNTTSYSYHMYAAMMKHNESLTSWLSNSVVAHAVSTSGLPHGPFEFRDIALDTGTDRWDGVSVHNPDAKVLPDGTIVIYYMGTNNHTAPYPSTGNQLEFNQRIGIAWSKDPNGPWERAEEPVLGPGPNGTWDDGFTTNPAPYIYNNGSVLLIYKAKSFNNTGMFQGVAFAESFNATYKKLSPKPLDLPPQVRIENGDLCIGIQYFLSREPINFASCVFFLFLRSCSIFHQCEDAGIYRTTSGVFRMLTHCGCNG